MFTNKTIVLTGANGGIGSEIAKLLSTAGATLVLVGRDEMALQQLNQRLGGQHHPVQADISISAGRQSIVTFCQDFKQGIDIVINNAGVGQFSLFEDMDEEQITSIININLSSTILLTQALLPLLLMRPRAQIINIGSILGSIGFPGSSVYCASKFGIRGFTEALRRELIDTQIAIRYFAPRATNTRINTDKLVAMNNELGTKMDSPEQVAIELVAFLKVDKPSQYLGWPEKLFVRINSILPGVVDKSLVKKLPVIKRYLQGHN